MKDKINELETNCKINNIRDFYRGISDFKWGYQPRTSIVKDKKCGLITDSHIILAKWRNPCCQLLNVYWVNDIRQTEIQTSEPLVP
jgi:hypothetical protein